MRLGAVAGRGLCAELNERRGGGRREEEVTAAGEYQLRDGGKKRQWDERVRRLGQAEWVRAEFEEVEVVVEVEVRMH